MVEKNIQAGGVVVFWIASGDSNLTVLGEQLKAIDMAQFMPSPRTEYDVLKKAFSEVFDGSNYLVRPLEKFTGVEVVREERGAERNTYAHVASGALDKEGGAPEIACDSMEREQRLRELLHKNRTLVGPSPITGSLTKIIEFFKGVSLRPAGGVYWLADDKAEKWHLVGKAFEACGQNQVFTLKVNHDLDMVKAVMAGLATEVETTTDAIDKDIMSGELGARGLQSRKDSAMALSKKVKEYEAILGVTLSALSQSVEKVESAAAAAVLLESATENK